MSSLRQGQLINPPKRHAPGDASDADRYLARNYEKLARKHANNTFCLLLKVVNSQAYGPDVVELVADVTRAAQPPVPAPRTSHRATG